MRAAVALLAGLVLAGAAQAAPPAVTAAATRLAGAAPLQVTLTATGDAATYTWDLGDGTTGEGAVVAHVYGPGRFVATVTATSAEGETSQSQVAVVAVRRVLTLEAPRRGGYEAAVTLAGSLKPAPAGARVQVYRGTTYVTSARVRANGRFQAPLRLRWPGPYHVRYGTTRSAPRSIQVRPELEASLPTTVPVGSALAVEPRLVPAAAGSVSVRVLFDGRRVAARPDARLPTGSAGTLHVEVSAQPRPGYAPVRRTLTAQIVLPSLSSGSRGPSVFALERRLAELKYALRGVDSVYGQDTFEAVIAFQKVNGLPRTGRVEPWLWRRLARAQTPRAQRGGDYIEVDKTRQVLFVVRGGEVTNVVHVSTGATGNTPLGSWSVYRKVGGWDWILWYPLYFKGGFAIHGYPSVPAYPASHGCVRIPMWIAPSLFGTHDYGTTVVVHL